MSKHWAFGVPRQGVATKKFLEAIFSQQISNAIQRDNAANLPGMLSFGSNLVYRLCFASSDTHLYRITKIEVLHNVHPKAALEKSLSVIRLPITFDKI